MDVQYRVEPWDEAVAFYFGAHNGLLFATSHELCRSMKTCGSHGKGPMGIAHASKTIISLWKKGQQQLEAGKCRGAKSLIKHILPEMKVILIQGVLYYSYVDSVQNYNVFRARVAAYVLSILPFIHHCNKEDAKTLFDNAQATAALDFDAIKQALEKNYRCLKVSCSSVGGVYDIAGRAYETIPCGRDTNKHPLVVGAILASVSLVTLLLLVRFVGTVSERYVVKYRQQQSSHLSME